MLPVDLVVRELLEALRNERRALLIAPPGAGKTTRVAPALLNEPWCSGQLLLLVPRRLAARAAAEFMASARGEEAGETIGYQTRLGGSRNPADETRRREEAMICGARLDLPLDSPPSLCHQR